MFLRRSCALFAENGLQAFVGVNNSGKSSWLRLFYELRAMFSAFSNQQAIYTTMLGNRQGYALMPLVKDPGEIFCDRNGRDFVDRNAERHQCLVLEGLCGRRTRRGGELEFGG